MGIPPHVEVGAVGVDLAEDEAAAVAQDDLLAFGLSVEPPPPDALHGAGEAVLVRRAEPLQQAVPDEAVVGAGVEHDGLPRVEVEQHARLGEGLTRAPHELRTTLRHDEPHAASEDEEEADQRAHGRSRSGGGACVCAVFCGQGPSVEISSV